MWGLYRLISRRYYRPIGMPPRDEGPGVININETIDASVFERWRADATYRPPALQSWARSKGIDPAAIVSAVRTDDPSVVVN